MPQTIIKLAITWGLLSIPVTVHAATKEHEVPLRQVHTRCGGGRVRLRRYCEHEDVEIPFEEVAPGYEAPDGRVVILSDDDLADLPLPTARRIEILAFVDADQIDPLALDTAYYLGTGPVGARPYALLRDVMRKSGRVAIARTALRTRESLAVLWARDEVIAMQTMLWPDQLRPAQEITIPETPPARRQELQMAYNLMDAMGSGFDLAEQHDDYSRALQRVVAARLQGMEPPHAPESRGVEGATVDLMAVLQQSVDAAQTRRAKPTGRKAAKKTAAKKTAAKKAHRRRSAG
ncbi:Ku protein [Streptomyces sp. NPDC056227]|uniref:non-homologous end joining protein Ku n=1 Tax=Streptomyces sp. NPDC056227 TaxID=3345753 RepID=UPI0035E1C216